LTEKFKLRGLACTLAIVGSRKTARPLQHRQSGVSGDYKKSLGVITAGFMIIAAADARFRHSPAGICG
jgi:hypothetical protein